MPYRTTTFALPSLGIAGLGAALLGPPAASAQERITLESIGAVRMARAEEIRRANPEIRSVATRPAREQIAERPSKAQ
ncbi:hypothetical protein MKK67_18815 [Methylobacterium sp. J-072]|uniref:hypothetical protein n=1 Tax=Methylobacterium sp. J-072 TaxID=2836651 RepID=UPI001FBA4300|nr:hypothetical protein [Methylobacterium sp. J-072]MCJ2094528.1 hypothetical protein [Methylobacterium sp. J-072]